MNERWAGVAAALAAAGAGSAWAAPPDPQALAPNYPVEIEDALPVPLGSFVLQLDQRFTRDRGVGTTSDLGQPEAVFKLGAAKGLQLDVSPSYSYGSSSTADRGFATVDALYQFTEDKGCGPISPSTPTTRRATAMAARRTKRSCADSSPSGSATTRRLPGCT